MGAPHIWLKAAIESAAEGVQAWPVENTGGGEPPYVIYKRDETSRSTRELRLLDETVLEDEIPPVASYTITIYADSYVEAWEIAGQITAAIHRFKGSADGETIDLCLVADERDGEAGYLEGREQPTFTVEQTVDISFVE